MRTVVLKTLLENLDVISITGSSDVRISMVTANSRKIITGGAFIAVKGLTVDAHQFIDTAIQLGAHVVFGERPVNTLPVTIPEQVTYVQLSNSRKSVGIICANFYGNPSKEMKVIGVTGTDGKTTTCHMIYKILQNENIPCGMISTLGAYIGEEKMDTGLHVTSPDPEDVQHVFYLMKEKGVTHAVIEVTSHGLDQDRFSGVHFNTGVLTNITHEHLDYHKTFENYRDAKLKLFQLAETSILNADDTSSGYILDAIDSKKVLRYGILSDADFVAHNIQLERNIIFNLKTNNETVHVVTNLVGKFNIYNCLAAITAAYSVGVTVEKAAIALSHFYPPTGRMEYIPNDKSLKIVVDFAHTPNGLQNLLTTLKELLKTKERLIVVFGSAGERDKQKRKLMGTIAGKLSSYTVITAEDPRSESVKDISEEIAEGITSEGGEYSIIEDRGEAISTAINTIAQSGDTVVICGKGHETSMAYGKIEYPWSDQQAVQYALQNKVLHLKAQ